MNSTELFHQDGKPAGVFWCGGCRIVHRTKDMADQCCQPNRCACGAECDKYWTICRSCSDAKDVQREQERFEKAEKIDGWDGPIFLEGTGVDGFSLGMNDFLENWENEYGDEPLPEYAWACSENCFCSLDVDKIIEDATQESYEEWDGEVFGRDDLASAIETFNKANASLVTWTPDYTQAILLK